MGTHRPRALVIDDDPGISTQIRRAVPDWTVEAVYNGVDGIAFVREHPNIDLVILDVQMPHDGILVARQIRDIDRTLRIMPYSQTEERAPLFDALGTAPLLLKSTPLNALRTAILRAAARPATPLPESPALSYIHDIAQESEQTLRIKLTRARVAILAATPTMLAVLQQAVVDAQVAVGCSATTIQGLEQTVRVITPLAIVTDDAMCAHATALAVRQSPQIPVVAITWKQADAIAMTGRADAILVEPDPIQVQAALQAVWSAQPYRDPALQALIQQYSLSERDLHILAYELRGESADAIAAAFSLSAHSVRRVRSEIWQRFGVTNNEMLIRWLNTGIGTSHADDQNEHEVGKTRSKWA